MIINNEKDIVTIIRKGKHGRFITTKASHETVGKHLAAILLNVRKWDLKNDLGANDKQNKSLKYRYEKMVEALQVQAVTLAQVDEAFVQGSEVQEAPILFEMDDRNPEGLEQVDESFAQDSEVQEVSHSLEMIDRNSGKNEVAVAGEIETPNIDIDIVEVIVIDGELPLERLLKQALLEEMNLSQKVTRCKKIAACFCCSIFSASMVAAQLSLASHAVMLSGASAGGLGGVLCLKGGAPCDSSKLAENLGQILNSESE